ncbi:MAG: FliA/WhiG family RNA polymerase sigma factor [Myxococcota bacterium]
MRRLRYNTDESVRRVEGMTRDEVCKRYQPKVMLLARRLHERLSSEVRIPVDDLAAVGAIGLLEAFDRFDAARGILFGTFAEYRIRGAMYDALRENDAFSRRRRQLSKRIHQAADEIRRAERRDPSAEEVAAKLGIDIDAYYDAVDRTKPVIHVPLDAPTDPDASEGGRALSDRLADPGTGADAGLVAQELKAALKEAILELPDRQRQCVMMYYSNELTLAEIAQVYGVTVSRVSQILSEAREKLRKKLVATVDRADLEDLGVAV